MLSAWMNNAGWSSATGKFMQLPWDYSEHINCLLNRFISVLWIRPRRAKFSGKHVCVMFANIRPIPRYRYTWESGNSYVAGSPLWVLCSRNPVYFFKGKMDVDNSVYFRFSLCRAFDIIEPCSHLWCGHEKSPLVCKTKKGSPLEGTECGFNKVKEIHRT